MTATGGGRASWRVWLLSLAVPLLFGAVGVAVRDSVPETWDEQFDQDIGRFYLHRWRDGGVRALEERFIPLQRHYGPAFALVVVWTHEQLQRLGWVTNPVASHHMATLAVTCLMLWVTFWLGRRLFGTAAGLVACLVLALLPQTVAHSQNNLKDMPLAAVFTLAVFAHLLALRRDRLDAAALALAAAGGAAVGYGFAIKPNALAAGVVVAVWALLDAHPTWRRLGRLAVLGGVSGLGAVATVPLVWPYYRSQPLLRLDETLATFREHVYNEYVFYLGEHVRAHEVPWHFPFVMLGVYTPVVVLALLAVALVFTVRVAAARRGEAGSWALGWVWLLTPPLVQIASGAPKLDGLRHYLTVLPAVALLAAGAAVGLGELLRRRRPLWRGAAAAAGILWIVSLLRTNVVYHPYQNVFFNALTGGTAGAQRHFELDYWGVSLAEAARWLNTHAPPGSRVWLTIPGQHFFKVDRSRLHFVNGWEERPHYKVNLLRGLLKTFDTHGDWRHPERPPVFAVRVAGAELLHILEYPEHRDIPAGSRLEASPAPRGLLQPGWRARRVWEPGAAGEEVVITSLELPCGANEFVNRPGELRAEGYLQVAEGGRYVFEIFSDDGAVLWFGERTLLSNASLATTRTTVVLELGWYPLRLEYRNGVGEACLAVRWGREGEKLEPLAAPALWHAAGER